MGYYYDNGNNFISQIPTVTKNLVAINILMFIATLINENFMVANFAMFYPASPFFKPWQILTHMFMHGGFWHIFFNMYSLLMFGSILERSLGPKKFLIFYFVTGLGAVALHTGVEWMQARVFIANGAAGAYQQLLVTPTLGASGAIYGVLIGFAMLYPQARLILIFPPIPVKAKWLVIIFAAIELFSGINGIQDGVAHFAHLGGMLFGWLLIRWWRKHGKLYY
jgi:hypothetical protein